MRNGTEDMQNTIYPIYSYLLYTHRKKQTAPHPARTLGGTYIHTCTYIACTNKQTYIHNTTREQGKKKKRTDVSPPPWPWHYRPYKLLSPKEILPTTTARVPPEPQL